MAPKKLRYNGFSFMARLLWCIENLENNHYTSMAKITEMIDSVNLWTDELSPVNQRWFKERAEEYMTTEAFKEERIRFAFRHKWMKQRGVIPAQFLESPETWFSHKVLKPLHWNQVTTVACLFRLKINEKKTEKVKNEKKDEEVEDDIKFPLGWLLGEN